MAQRGLYTSIESTADQAESLVNQGRFAEAERYFRELVAQTHVIDYEYDDWLRRLAEIYRQVRRRREAGFIYLYLHYFDLARDAFAGDDAAGERARVLEVEKRWAEAAELYAQEQLAVHAAVCFEKARQYKAAGGTWEALARHPALRDRPYEQALVHFNVGMATEKMGGDATVGRRAL